MKRFWIFVAMLMFAGAAASQGFQSENFGKAPEAASLFNRLNINQEPGIQQLVEWHIRKNQQMRGIQGFRVEIFFSSALDARQRALRTKTEFLSLYPEIPVHVIYLSPDFKVRVGDFRTRNEALELMKNIQDRFPKAFIVPDIIDFPKLIE